MGGERTEAKARWLRDLERFLPLKSQVVLTGNIRDLQIRAIGDTVTTASLEAVLAAVFAEAGYGDVVAYDPISGFRVVDRPDGQPADSGPVFTRLGLTAHDGVAPAGLDLFSATLERLVRADGPPLALIADFASRLLVRPDSLTPSEHQAFTRALVLSQTAEARPVGRGRSPLFNTVIWVADREGDLPDWFVIDNPRLRHISLSPPDRAVRTLLAPNLVRALPGARDASAPALADAQARLVDDTEGLLLVDLNAIVQLARSEGVPVGEVSEAVRRYKLGVTEDAWKKIDRARIRDGVDQIRRRVVGQDHAVVHLLDIVKRSVTGVSGAKRGGRPRGVAFLAGPTGVGKTELAKAVTELLFGDEGSYIRFDMSEFSAEHSDQRLIGAPPGYVGYDVGGELTNAIRERPFSVVLFDEIEKAHPRILDKFLQVLDDGVLTSGRGDRVYFSEALIIFTSNLGIYSADGSGGRVANVTADQSFAEIQSRVRGEIESHFKLVLNRPEILNRIGDNIIVFDFIRPRIADQIFDDMVTTILAGVAETGYRLRLTPEVQTSLRELCTADLSNGGRGIRNKLETHLINPLGRTLFELETQGAFVVTAIEAAAVTSLTVEAA